MENTFTNEQIKLVRKEVRGIGLMQQLEQVCETKRLAKRTTVFTAMNSDKYNDANPVHRLIILEAIALVADNGGNVDWFSKEMELDRLESAAA